ncbi:comEA protein [Enterococcus villorum]|uniref:ComEA protein n=1 Tax=Enterococcus villorum TaxID=112904 RepID=A0A1V8YF69_9ENTE|nr:helix-hairpin-helix domain-containing protein [Enterococcus villorum]OQO71287.1 comEA protein [Enterococcus villorum]OQO73528.1 comEA protein [Enterococcus villorum]
MKKIYQQIFDSPKLIICGALIILGLMTLIGLAGHSIYHKMKNQTLLTSYSNEELMANLTQESQQSKELVEETTETTVYQTIYVDVKGAVNRPGMYAFTAEERVFDVIQKSGGFTDVADEKQINFAAKIKDQQLLYVPEIGEEIEEKYSDHEEDTEIGESKVPQEKINLNTANSLQLQQIPGIGEKKAQEIIQYRQDNGSFKSVEELQEISGIGQKTVEKMKNFVTITIE